MSCKGARISSRTVSIRVPVSSQTTSRKSVCPSLTTGVTTPSTRPKRMILSPPGGARRRDIDPSRGQVDGRLARCHAAGRDGQGDEGTGGQQDGETGQRHLHAEEVGDAAGNRHPNAACDEAETEDDSGRHSDPTWYEPLRHDQRNRKRRITEEANQRSQKYP